MKRYFYLPLLWHVYFAVVLCNTTKRVFGPGRAWNWCFGYWYRAAIAARWADRARWTRQRG